MSYRIAGIDVHKRMLAVVVSDVEVADEFTFERRQFGTTPAQLHELAEWLIVQQAEEVVMESTAQYWKPVWGSLERDWKPLAQQRTDAGRMAGTLHLAQAQSNRARPGRKRDFPDAERLVKRFVAHELTLSFVPDPAQRLWRTLTRTKCQLTRNRVQLQNRLEALLEEAHIKLSSLVSDLLGASARRMLEALSKGATDPAALAALANVRLRATQEQLRDALGACQDLNPVYRRLVRMALDDLELLERHINKLDQELADLLAPYHDQVQRLAEVPGLGVDSAQQIMAEVGVTAPSFPSPRHLASWVGACPGDDESAGVSPQPSIAKGKSSDAASSESSRQCRREIHRQYLSGAVSSLRPAAWTQANDRHHRPQTVPTSLEDSAPGCALRGTRPGDERTIQATSGTANDPRPPKPGVSR
jgi:transposase